MLAGLLALLTLTAVAVVALRAGPRVVTGVMPGSFTGYAFDACQAPSQRQMDVWLERSPYWAVGIYIAGENRACARQPNLDSAWVAAQAQRGWRLLPLTVGRQAPCSESSHWSKIDGSPDDRYAAARDQGRDEAGAAAAAAADLGIAHGSTLWLDLEAFDIARIRCRDATLAYVSSWTQGLREDGYRSGVYSSASSGIRMLEQARVGAPGRYDLPRQVWVAAWNRRHDAGPAYVSRDGWPGGRVHQYRGTHVETYGGVSLEIDSSFMDVGRGTVAPRRHIRCAKPLGVAVRAGRGSGPLLKYGSGGDDVRRLQCALDAVERARVPATGVFEERTRAAVERYQRTHRLPASGVVTADVWRLLRRG